MAQDAKSRLPKENTQAVLFSGLIFDAFRQIKKGGFFYMPWKLPREEKEDPHGRASPHLSGQSREGRPFPLAGERLFPYRPTGIERAQRGARHVSPLGPTRLFVRNTRPLRFSLYREIRGGVGKLFSLETAPLATPAQAKEDTTQIVK